MENEEFGMPSEFGAVIGIYLGMRIHDWVIFGNEIYEYDGIAEGPLPGLANLSLLEINLFCIIHGLRYRIRDG